IGCDFTAALPSISLETKAKRSNCSAPCLSKSLASTPQRLVGTLQPGDQHQKLQGGRSPVRELPLVSCIMPTYNRRAFAPLALEYFRRQTYPDRELIVVDDGSDPVGDVVDSWATDAGAANGSRGVSVRYVRLHRRH